VGVACPAQDRSWGRGALPVGSSHAQLTSPSLSLAASGSLPKTATIFAGLESRDHGVRCMQNMTPGSRKCRREPHRGDGDYWYDLYCGSRGSLSAL